ncbi:Sapep family Mn(2+)-dependent dipeptidase [Proteiniclasticum sp. BAD-10]|uniref:Sapep family Mn(2+)-dependent dipeptidase n=1 Tax=Proteiniclasticum sediminis TaxID=2804028 RepID=A0A941CP70_9CLOT|nr:Sapep family Mn(2+)-dependent dipeptidase [Proteiniclasticum sediminis]MBR0576217.1 Sapep family Mn(2+)-dependent dipeptidase [Proteiniclasticum sediminis]
MTLAQYLEQHKEEMIRDVLRLVATESVRSEGKPGMPSGEKVHQVLQETLELAKSHGLKTFHVDGHAGVVEYGEGEDYVAVLGHLDVVPAGDGWSKNPLGEVTEDKLYGRGTMDDKGPMVAALYGLIAIKELQIPLKHRIRLIFGTSEETGGPDIEKYLEQEKQPVAGFTPDADFPAINAEKGILVIRLSKKLEESPLKALKGGKAVNMVPDFASYTLRLGESLKTDTFAGVSAHGSTPHLGENAISKMLEDLVNREELQPIKNTLSVLWYNLCQDLDGHAMGIALEDEASGKLVLNLGKIALQEDVLAAEINIRYPVTYKMNDVTDNIKTIFESQGFQMEILQHDAPLYYPQDADLVVKLMDVYTRETRDQRPPLAIGGGTYAKMMKNIVAFGPQLPGRPDTIHQVDEYILLEDLMTCARIYANAMVELAK